MKNIGSITLLVLLLISCSKLFKKPQWDVNYQGAVVNGVLGLNDIIPDSLQREENGLLWFNYSTTLYEVNTDDLINIPDTTASNSLTFPFNFNAQPGQQIYDDGVSDVDLEGGDVELTFATFKSGKLFIRLYHNIPEPVKLVCTVPGVLDTQGNPYRIEEVVQPTNDVNIPNEVLIDLTGFTSSLKGVDNNQYNKFSYNIVAYLDESANPYTITFGSKITVEGRFEGLKVAEAQGYFGQTSTSVTENNLPLSFLDQLSNGGINIDSAFLDLNIENNMGVDLEFKINQFSTLKNGTSTPLNHSPLYQTQWLTRAIKNNGNIIPTYKNFQLNHQNSNITSFIELLPNNLNIEAYIALNPLGNISMWNDFINTTKTLSINGTLGFPLNVNLQSIILSDTLSFEPDNVNEASFYLNLDNQFPIDITIKMGILVNNQMEWLVADQETINALSSGVNTYVLSTSQAALLAENNKIVIQTLLNTPNGKVTLAPEHQLNYQISTNANLTINHQ